MVQILNDKFIAAWNKDGFKDYLQEEVCFLCFDILNVMSSDICELLCQESLHAARHASPGDAETNGSRLLKLMTSNGRDEGEGDEEEVIYCCLVIEEMSV